MVRRLPRFEITAGRPGGPSVYRSDQIPDVDRLEEALRLIICADGDESSLDLAGPRSDV
jgi:hypothetical protein